MVHVKVKVRLDITLLACKADSKYTLGTGIPIQIKSRTQKFCTLRHGIVISTTTNNNNNNNSNNSLNVHCW